VTSDHYLVLDLDQLPALIDAIGGLPIDIPETITDPWIGTVIEAGSQTLSGDQLRAYSRAIPDSDFARIQRSNLVIQALRQKLLDPSLWVKLPSLYEVFAKKMIVTDLSYQQIFSIFCLVRDIPTDEIVMQKVDPAWTAPGPEGSLLWDKGKVNAALLQLGLLP
jgi:anionic cell wall polymer biosynthesis LytR-Cps2A-Psr (LCP) family protein